MAAICMRIESEKMTANGGWLHILDDHQPTSPRQRHRHPVQQLPRDLSPLATQFQRSLTDTHLVSLALHLGVATDALRRIRCGFNGRATCFPMTDGQGRVVGIRYRHPQTGNQWSEKGGKEGLFVPMDLPEAGPLLLPEGPTDSAALLSICDLAVIGRPSCSGGVKHCVEFARHRDVVICADADEPGRRGAEALATALLVVASSVRVIEPPAGHKDFRDSVRAGLTAADLRSLIDSAAPRRLTVRIRR